MRGWDVTAMPLDKRNNLPYNTSSVWIDPKTGKAPIQKTIWAKTQQKTMQRLENETSAVGRYHIRYHWKGGSGHILCLDRLPNGDIRIYDPQNNSLNPTNWTKRVDFKKGFHICKVDELLSNPDKIKQIVKRR